MQTFALFQLLLEEFSRSVLVASFVFSWCWLNSSSTLLFTLVSHDYLILIVWLPLCLCFAWLSRPSFLLSSLKSVSMLVPLSSLFFSGFWSYFKDCIFSAFLQIQVWSRSWHSDLQKLQLSPGWGLEFLSPVCFLEVPQEEFNSSELALSK